MPPPPAQLFASRVLLGPALRAQPDRRLVDLVRDGYDSAFEEIVRRYGRPLDRFAAAIVGGRAEDVTQDAFSKALEALRRSESEIELRPWLYRIVRNTALNDLRDRGPSAEQLLESLPGAAGADADAERREELAELMRRLHALPEAQRAALVMRELEGLSHDEIAAALGVSGGAARQAIHRARSALRAGAGLLVPMPLLRAIAEPGGAVGAAAAGGAGMAGAGLGGGAIKIGLATVLVAGSVAGGVAIRHHEDRLGPEAAAAAPRHGAETRELAATRSRTGGTRSDDDRRRNAKGGEAEGRGDDTAGSGSSAGLGAGSQIETDGSATSGGGPRRHSAGEGVSGGAEDHHGGHSGPGESGDGSGLADSDVEDHSGRSGGGDGLQSGSGHDGSGDDSSGSGSGPGSGESIESELQSGSDSSGSGSSGSDSSGTGSSGSDGGATSEPTSDGGSSGSGSGDSGTSGPGSGGSDDFLSSGS